MKYLDPVHMAAIQAVLAAIPRDMPVARAALVFEDAYVVCGFGLEFGLPMEAIQRKLLELLTDELPPP